MTTSEPTAPLSDEQLAAIRARVAAEVICPAAHPDEADKSHLWVTGSLSGRDHCGSCSVARRVVDTNEAVLLAEVDRLRAVLAEREELAAEYGARIVAASMAAAPREIPEADHA
jgi:hypothetical protein